LGRSVSVELGLNVNLSTSEKTLVCLAEDGAPEAGATTIGTWTEEDTGISLSLPRMPAPVAAFAKARKKPSLLVEVADVGDGAALAAPEAFSFCFEDTGGIPEGPAEPTPNRAPGRLTLAGWKVTLGL